MGGKGGGGGGVEGNTLMVVKSTLHWAYFHRVHEILNLGHYKVGSNSFVSMRTTIHD